MKKSIVTAAIAILAIAVSAPGDVLVLEGGARIEGKVIKKTEESLFVDLGFTIIAVPAKAVKEVQGDAPAAPAAPVGPAAGAAPAPAPGAGPGPEDERRQDLWSSRSLKPGLLKDKAREVAEGVVQIICPGKSGSGFIINDEGHVVTNCHVVEGDQNIAVVIYVREESNFRKVRLDRVKIIAFNPFLDLALLKIEEDQGPGVPRSPRLRKVYLGDGETVRVGDPVFAVGSPLGLERTVTEGIVSNNRRALGGNLYLQTSAPINPGNSGGPLFNDRGEVVGITSMKAAMGESLGFAIPVKYLKDFLDHREAFAFDKDNPNTGIRYLPPPRKTVTGLR
jgi:serine protease Do